MNTRCTIAGCGGKTWARGLCSRCYGRHYRAGTLDQFSPINFVNPMVCDCAEPDPDSCCGMCRTCKRKPLELMEARA